MRNRTIDEQGYERRTKRVGRIRCRCMEWVELTADTEAWTKASPAIAPIKWRHTEYGPPTGDCDCGFCYCGMPDGHIVRLDLQTKKKKRAATPLASQNSAPYGAGNNERMKRR